MPPKKKGKKGAKKGAKKGEDVSDKDLIGILEAQKNAFETKYIKEEELANQSKGAENEIKQRVLDCRMILEEEKRSKIEIAGEMASQYKRLQENLQNKMMGLTNQANKLQAEITNREETLERMKKERDAKIQKKDAKIDMLKKSMAQMSDKFLGMLQDTLKKMKERIDSASNEFEKAGEGSLKRKLEEMNIGKP